MATMTESQLNKHIEEQFAKQLESEFGTKLADTVRASVDAALKDVKADQQSMADQIKGLGKRDYTKEWDTKERKSKAQWFGTCIRAARKAPRDVEAAAAYAAKWDPELGAIWQEDLKTYEDRLKSFSMKAMQANDPEVGGILVPEVVSTDIIDLLRAAVVVRAMGATQVPMPSGNFTLPKKTQSTSSYYVGESQAAPISKVKTGSVKASFKKLVTSVPVSNDFIRYASIGGDTMIRNDIVDSMRVREDQAFLRDSGNDATTGATTPKGIRQWAIDGGTNMVSNPSLSLANVTTDLGNIILKLIEANVPMARPGWIMAPRTWNYLMTVRTTNGPYAFRDEMSRGTLWGWPFRYTTTIPTNLTVGALTNRSELYLVDFADVVVGDAESLMIDASDSAAYDDGGTVRAAFSRDETVIRAITEHDLVVRRNASIAFYEDINWA